ncbi:MAG: alpha/beta hydrolase [Candidatus Sulfotelmatobacter sp.]
MSHIQQDFVIEEADRELSTDGAPPAGATVEECWMDIAGARMRYLRAGSGPALILLHGLLGYSFSWRFTLPALAPFATVYAPDLPGAGFSDRAPGIDHSLRATAQRLLLFAEKLGLSSFDLLGTSHGGAVAMMAAAECLSPEARLRVRRLILVAPVNPYSAHGRRMAPFLGSRFGSALFRHSFARMNFLYPYWHSRMYGNRQAIPPGALEGYIAPLAVPGLVEHGLNIVRTWTRDLRELEATLPKVAHVPTLLMWGSKDPAVFVSSAAALSQHFSSSRTVVFEGIGHLPYEECPEEFNGALIEFLTEKTLPA